MKIVPASDSSLLVVFGETVSLATHRRVMALFHALQVRSDLPVRDLHPGYASLLVDFDPLHLGQEALAAVIESLAIAEPAPGDREGDLVVIPVCYDAELAPDLAEVAHLANLSPQEVGLLHASAEYRVYFLGFSPGFAYLGGLPAPLHTPRLATPRRSVAAGSVGIAGAQTGVYPVDSPGGWRLIGRTPLRMFDPQADPPTRLRPGDRVKFSVIDRTTFQQMSAAS